MVYLDESKEVQYDFSPSMLPFHNRLFPTNLKAHFQQCVSQTQGTGIPESFLATLSKGIYRPDESKPTPPTPKTM